MQQIEQTEQTEQTEQIQQLQPEINKEVNNKNKEIKLSAFTFLRNADTLGYPYQASILSIIDHVDEFVINVGLSNNPDNNINNIKDQTLETIQKLQAQYPKIRIIQSHWNEKMQAKGFVYAQQKMIAQYNCTGDWAFYLEGDEVLHEADAKNLKANIAKYHDDVNVEAFAFKYFHFYGGANHLAISPAWYRKEVRIIRNTIRSYAPDGLFWTVMHQHKKGRYPKAIILDMHIYHYGHARKSEYLSQRAKQVAKYWNHAATENIYGAIDPQSLIKWHGGAWQSHPAVMSDWLELHAEKNFELLKDYRLSRREKKHRWAMKLEKLLGIDLAKSHLIPLNKIKTLPY